MIVRGLVFIARALPLDARARRAVGEVLADWRFEQEQARTLAERVQVDLRTAWALLAVLAITGVHDARGVWRSGAPARAALLIVVPFAAMRLIGIASGAETGTAPAMMVDLSAYAVLFMPLALFLALELDRRPPVTHPFLGIALTSALAVFLLAGWIQPSVNQWYREHAFAAAGGSGELSAGPRELSIFELAGAVLRSDAPRAAIGALSARLSLILACPLAVLVASRSRGRHWHRWTALVTALVAYNMFAGLAFSPDLVPIGPLQPWVLPVALLLLFLVLQPPTEIARAAR